MDLRGFNQPLLPTTDPREELLRKLQQSQQAQAKPRVSGAARFAIELLPGGSLLTKKINNEKISGGDVALEALLSLPGGKAVRGAVKGAKAANKALRKSDLEGYLARSAQQPTTMRGVNELASQKRIPVTFFEDANFQGATPVAKSAKGIPVQYVDTSASGRGVRNTTNKALFNPTISDIENASTQLANEGYATSTRVQKFKGRKSFAGSGRSVYEPSDPQSLVRIRGEKTDIPLLDQVNGTTTLPAKQQAVSGYSAPVKSGRGYVKSQQAIPEVPAYGATPSTPADLMQTSTTTSRRQRAANTLTARGSGLKVGENVGDINRLDEATQLYQRYGITGTPTKQLRKIESTMGNLGTQVDDILARNPVPMSGGAVRATVQKAVDDPLRYAELDLSLPGVKRNLDMHLTKFGQATSAKDVNDYIKTLNPIAKRAQDKLNRGVALTDKEAAALAAKKAGDEALSAIPEIKPYKKDMAILFERNAQTAKEVGKGSNIPVIGGVLKAPNSLMRSAQSKAGARLAANSPQDLMSPRQAVQQYLLKRQAPIQGAQSLLSSPPESQQVLGESPGTQGVQDLLAQMGAGDEGSSSPQDIMGGDATGYLLGREQSGPSLESLQRALIEDQQLTGGQNNEFLMQLAELNGISPDSQKLSTDQRKGIAATTNAENVINEIEQAFSSVGGGQGALQGQARNLLGKVRLDQNARYYNDIRQAFLSRIARAFGEVGTLNEGDIQRAINAIPDIADTPENAQNKIAVLRGLLGKAKQSALSGNYATYGDETSQSGNFLTQMNGL